MPPGPAAPWAAWWRCSPTARASCSYSALGGHFLASTCLREWTQGLRVGPAPCSGSTAPGHQQAAAVPSGRGRICSGFTEQELQTQPLSEETGILPSRRWRWQACSTVPPSILKSESRDSHLFTGESEEVVCLGWLSGPLDVVGVVPFL